MTKRQAKPCGERVKDLMAQTIRVLSKAQAFADGAVSLSRSTMTCSIFLRTLVKGF
jgi:hypothetical protein